MSTNTIPVANESAAGSRDGLHANGTSRALWGAIIGITVAAVLWGGTWLAIPHLYPSVNRGGKQIGPPITNPGMFGEMFGAVGALFAGLSLAGVAYAVVLQSVQLRHQEEGQDILNKLLQETVHLQQRQAEALGRLAEVMNSKSERESIETRIRFNRDQIKSLESRLPAGWVAKSPQDKYRESLNKEINGLKNENATLETTLKNPEITHK